MVAAQDCPSTVLCFGNREVRKVIYTDYTTKVIQRAIYDVLYEPIQRGFITDTYACVTDRGQHEAVRRLASWFHEFNGRGQYAYHEMVDRVNLDHLDLICEALDCSLDELIVRVPNKTPRATRTINGSQKSKTDE